ncbi:P-loop containing nucleoside triphosphate hydrolase protein, partial [Rickenella mellea]
LEALLLEAKTLYKLHVQDRVTMFTPDFRLNDWRVSASQPNRTWDSVILDENVKKSILTDATNFFEGEEWYRERGIPWRRGIMFHGAPGSGKSSFVHALASKLCVPICIVSLGDPDMNDSTFKELMSRLPTPSLALIEDIDISFRNGLNREDTGLRSTYSSSSLPSSKPQLTLAGILNALDGVNCHEGHMLIATSNKPDSLDTALTRAGRIDAKFKFHAASHYQASTLFNRFYKPDCDQLVHLEDAAHENIELGDLATRFADSIASHEMSMAELQGHLMCFRSSAHDAVLNISSLLENKRTNTSGE